jgi:hypothetical protein
MGYPQRPDLAVARLIAVEKKKIGDSLVGASKGDAAFVNASTLSTACGSALRSGSHQSFSSA